MSPPTRAAAAAAFLAACVASLTALAARAEAGPKGAPVAVLSGAGRMHRPGPPARETGPTQTSTALTSVPTSLLASDPTSADDTTFSLPSTPSPTPTRARTFPRRRPPTDDAGPTSATPTGTPAPTTETLTPTHSLNALRLTAEDDAPATSPSTRSAADRAAELNGTGSAKMPILMGSIAAGLVYVGNRVRGRRGGHVGRRENRRRRVV